MAPNRRKKYDAGSQKSDAKGIEVSDHAGGSKLYVEDGWIFRVKLGLPIEYRRDGDDT